ncbi:MAG: protein-disulfide reductase DsbD domain-containing protein, partial [Bacteroidota bacterium]
MKYYIGLIALFLGLQCSTAQLGESHAEWAHRVNPISDDTFELVFEATIDPEWFIYSLYTAEGGSMPSEFEFVGAGEDYELLGKTIEGKTYKKYTEVFEVEETFFKEQALLKQKIRLLKPEVNQLEVILYYQICKEVCILEEAVFNITLDGSEVVANTKTLDENSIARTNALKLDLKNTALLQTEALQNKSGVSNSWVLFGLGFLGGLIALLTPCVFPLIPLTVSFFTKHAQNRTKGVWSALLYG